MKQIYIAEIKAADAIGEEFEKLNYVTSILRSLLQLVTVSAIELTERQTCTDNLVLDSHIQRFKTPSDGMPITILDYLIPHLRAQLHQRICSGWFEKTTSNSSILTKELQAWVEFRNKHPGHGVTDRATANHWADKMVSIVKQVLSVFDELIPARTEDGRMSLRSEQIDCIIETPLCFEGQALVISKIHQKKASWKLNAQTLTQTNSTAITLELPASTVFSSEQSHDKSYKLVSITTDHSEHIIEHNIPIRQTDTFAGREKEIILITDWLNDHDSRRCQIYGDGGYGKTTLLLESLNRYLEGRLLIKELEPTVICYYTAKMTRWNAAGLTHLSGVPPIMTECLHELLNALHLPIDRSLYSATCKQLIGRVETELKNNKLTRNDVLLVIDNTETLAIDKEQTEEFADLLREIGKRLCRLIITSRRQESIEAKPILVAGLSLDDSVSLLNRLAKEHGAKPILQAGLAKLRKVSEKLMYKPILLEALVVYVARANIGIDEAMDNLYQRSEESLLEFLYDDAWARLNEGQKNMFFVSVAVSAQLNDVSIGRACQLIEIPRSDFERSLDETHFAKMISFSSRYDIELVELAKRFFEQKLSNTSPEVQAYIKDIASQVDLYVAKREDIEKAYTEDRVAGAFRNEYAKTAKVLVDKGEIDEADGFYQIAIQEDPTNAALHDRYGLFLLNKFRDPQRARQMSEKAVTLNPSSCDANVTLAMVFYRLSNLVEGDKQIDISKKLGRPDDFCYLQKGIARYHQSFKLSDPEARVEQLEKAESLLNIARKASNTDTGYGAKNLSEIIKYKELVLKRIRGINKYE
ncbi:MAG: hypothetical protein RPS99_00015 [Gammaproteobacteria bacterium]